ncbi:MAG: hypothetical protein J6Q19_07575 [Bacteroidaceae bacterium]|nr:hypothetical protein [Bacteroidaceae bacterium]
MALELDSNILLTVISINMTIIGLTSLAEKKTIIGVDYGKYLINNYKLFHIFPMYLLLILFAIINVIALFTLYLTDYNFRTTIFVGLTICLSFAIYYFFGFILRENKSVKSQIYENEFIGLYYKDNTPPGAECDRIVKMNNGFRTSKRLSTDIITYFNKFNNDTQKDFEESFGPESFIYKRNSRIKKKYLRTIGHEPYDYSGPDGLMHISWEFFQLFRWSDLQEKWITEILVLFNDKYAVNSPEMRLNNVIRVFFHINAFGRTENMFGYRVIDYIYKYIKDSFSCNCEYSEERIEKEKILMNYYCKYLFTCINSHYSEQSYKMVVNLLKELINIPNKKYHISKDEKMKIILSQSAKFEDEKIEQVVTIIYNQYYESSLKQSQKITPTKAKEIITSERKDFSYGTIAIKDLYS